MNLTKELIEKIGLSFFLYIVIVLSMSVGGFILMGIDKVKAKRDSVRIPERVLLIVSAIGGSFGTIAGMVLFHHKINKKKFYIGIPILYLLNFIIGFSILLNGIMKLRN